MKTEETKVEQPQSEVTKVDGIDFPADVKVFAVNGKNLVFRRPTRAEMSLVYKRMAETKDVVGFQTSVLKTTCLHNKELLEEDAYLFALGSKVDEIINTFTVELVK